MKIYQCIHKYPPHIPAFERRWGIGDHSTFAEIHDALIRDGYASVYRLVPSQNHSDDEVFFVVWNYERLQHAWAKENGVSTSDFDAIRLAQIESFKPDIVYDFSYFVSPEFIEKVKHLTNAVTLSWYAYIKSAEPPTDIPYHGMLSLHRPYIKYWKSNGISALELQPAIDKDWLDIPLKSFGHRKHDLIFYGQVTPGLYGDRMDVISGALKASRTLDLDFACLTQYRPEYYRPGGFLARRGLEVPFLRKWPKRELSSCFQEPKYGSELYEEIRDSRITLNTFGDFNGSFKSNMRIFEAIGNGSVLLTPRGDYPDNLVENDDYLAFENDEELVRKVREVFEDPSQAEELCRKAQKRIGKNFTKERQYDLFFDFASGLV